MVSQGTCPNLESSPTLGLEILYFIQMGGSLYFIIPVCAHVLCPHPHIPWVTSVIHDLHSDFYFSCLTRSHHSYPELMDRLSSESLPMIWKAKTVVYPCSNPFGLHGKLGQLSKLNIFWWKKRVFSGNSTYWSKQVGSLSGNLQCRGTWDAAGSCKRWVRLKIRQPQMPCFIILSSQNHGSSCCLSKKTCFVHVSNSLPKSKNIMVCHHLRACHILGHGVSVFYFKDGIGLNHETSWLD